MKVQKQSEVRKFIPVEELEKSKPNNNNKNDFPFEAKNKLDELSQQIIKLQAEISALKTEWEREPKPRTLTKLVGAEKKLAELQKAFQQKSSENEETSQKRSNFSPNSPQPDKQFPWLWVVIPMGILMIGLIFLVFWLWRKKSKCA